MLPIYYYLFLSSALLLIGIIGIVARRNIVIKLFSIELILNAVIINLMAFARVFADAGGQTFSMFIFAIIAAEFFVAVAIVAAVFRRWQNPSSSPAERDAPAL